MQATGHGFRILPVLAVVVLALAWGRTAEAAQYAAIIMDMRNGAVLDELNADQRLHPASLTKMMTLYLAFEAVENGQLRLDQKVRVSRDAARQPPTKLYLKQGQLVSIRSLIRASAVRSANDAAVALAEAIGGSEKAFARLMTAKARQLGMRNTTFRNANGLTEQGHLSTARDMAILARHLYFDFPEYYNLFGRKSTNAAGKRIGTTNRLLSAYRGADGIKTGYTRAAGYNLAASAQRGNKRILAVIFGGESSAWRNARMIRLLDRGFARAPTHVAVVPPVAAGIALARAPLPRSKPGAPATGLQMLARVLASEAVASTTDSTSAMAPLYSAMPLARPGATIAQGAGATDATDATDTTGATETTDGADGIPLPEPRPGWAVELGRFEDRALAVARVTEVTLGDVETLADAAPEIEVVRGRTGAPLYRVRFIGLAPSYATRACQTLHETGRACVALAPGT
ncbi:MAG TPA: D-alanyl-D-alanine carboxypeptidase family protein [Thermohalobaculum sp.]|nr:D-alanyl-D-alanine carboxypeptidase family protein [Thermohalobaculum sp.]